MIKATRSTAGWKSGNNEGADQSDHSLFQRRRPRQPLRDLFSRLSAALRVLPQSRNLADLRSLRPVRRRLSGRSADFACRESCVGGKPLCGLRSMHSCLSPSCLVQGQRADAGSVIGPGCGNLPFIQGITVSGGECMLYADFLTNSSLYQKRPKTVSINSME